MVLTLGETTRPSVHKLDLSESAGSSNASIRVLEPDTPTVTKHCFDADAFGELENGRKAWMADIGGYINEISVRTFVEDLLPPLPNGVSVDSIMARLTAAPGEAGETTALDVDKGWSAFKRAPITQSDEGVAFPSPSWLSLHRNV